MIDIFKQNHVKLTGIYNELPPLWEDLLGHLIPLFVCALIILAIHAIIVL